MAKDKKEKNEGEKKKTKKKREGKEKEKRVALSAMLCLDPDGGRVRSPLESEAQGQRRTALKRVHASARPLRSSGP